MAQGINREGEGVVKNTFMGLGAEDWHDGMPKRSPYLDRDLTPEDVCRGIAVMLRRLDDAPSVSLMPREVTGTEPS